MTLQFDLTPEEMEVFLQEVDEHIAHLDECLVQLERADDDTSVLQEIFRSAHTIKGAAATIGHQSLTAVTHEMETVLDRLRNGQLAVQPELVDVLFAALDVIRAMVGEVQTREPSGVDADGVVMALRQWLDAPPGTREEMVSHDEEPILPEEATVIADEAVGEGAQVWQVYATIAEDSVALGGRALQVLLALQQSSRLLWSAPTIEELDEHWNQHQVQAVIAEADSDQVSNLLAAISEVEFRLWRYQPATRAEEHSRKSPAGGLKHPVAPAKASSNGTTMSTGQTRWVKTSVERLDKLMNLVGELVTDRNRLSQIRVEMTRGGDVEDLLSQLGDAISHLSWITDQLQDEVMRARMVPVSQIFNKFPRLVRSVARDLGKHVDLQIEGQDTELDRSVIELINDPLIHLIRNAIDHGIEPPEERIAAGKAATGVIRLSARSEESHIVVTVEDDGRGIDPERIRAAAVSKGIIDAEAAQRLSDEEALDLIFASGFSTAKKVTELSGRGVGMDVVRTNVERLNGSVRVKSQVGKGTTFELRLPLTLAIMPALMVAVRGQTYAVPLVSVMTTLRVGRHEINNIMRRGVIRLRDRILPLISLAEFFGWGEEREQDTCYVVALRLAETQVGLVVDHLLGQQEVVVKPLGYLMGDAPGIAGGTILGDGRVALIIDVPGLVQASLRDRQIAAAA